MEHIKWLLEITEGEHNHKLLLSVKNLWELGTNADVGFAAVRFAVQMRKRAASAKRETALGSEGLGGKCPKRSVPNEEA